MQTSAKGTYRGMLDCAGGILRNEGPLAFYKVDFAFVLRHNSLTVRKSGYSESTVGHRRLRFHTIRRSRVYETLLHVTQCPSRTRRGSKHSIKQFTTRRCG